MLVECRQRGRKCNPRCLVLRWALTRGHDILNATLQQHPSKTLATNAWRRDLNTLQQMHPPPLVHFLYPLQFAPHRAPYMYDRAHRVSDPIIITLTLHYSGCYEALWMLISSLGPTYINLFFRWETLAASELDQAPLLYIMKWAGSGQQWASVRRPHVYRHLIKSPVFLNCLCNFYRIHPRWMRQNKSNQSSSSNGIRAAIWSFLKAFSNLQATKFSISMFSVVNEVN